MADKRTDDYDWKAVIDALPTAVADAVKEAVQPELAAPFYDARKIFLPAGEVLELFGYDAARVRFYLRATFDNPTTDVQIGDRDQVTAELGFSVGTTAFTEFHTVAALCVKAINGPAVIDLWAEYRSR